MNYVLCFLAAVCLDFVWANYIRLVAAGDRWGATIASGVVGGVGLVGMTTVIGDDIAAIPWLLGLGVGTWMSMGDE